MIRDSGQGFEFSISAPLHRMQRGHTPLGCKPPLVLAPLLTLSRQAPLNA